ncbi:MAG: cytochrome c biogenesis protein CcdA [Chloroflexota bacterium]
MFEIGGVSIFVAFAAGLLSVASPCVLPLVPAYLGYLTGATLEGVPLDASVMHSAAATTGGGTITVAAQARVRTSAPSPFLHAIAFCAGFTAVFVAFGISIGLVGYVLKDHQDFILKVSGALLIVMGLHLSGVITIPFMEQERRVDVGNGSRVGYARSFFVGSAFSAGWSPCIGPTLASIFALSVSSHTVLQGGLLLLAYSAGLSIPFLGLGLAYKAVEPIYVKIKKYSGAMNYLAGALLIIIGILIFTNSVSHLNSTFDFGLPGSNV